MILGCWRGKACDVSSLKRYYNVIKTTATLLAIRFFLYCRSYLICLTLLLPQKCIPACSKAVWIVHGYLIFYKTSSAQLERRETECTILHLPTKVMVGYNKDIHIILHDSGLRTW